jgi:hypothetical protein
MDSDKHLNIGSRKKYINARHISTNIDFFNTESIVVKILNDKLIFRKPDISYRGKLYMVQKIKTSKNWYSFALTSEIIPLGKFYPSIEESNEDQLVFYFNEENE